MNINRVYAIFLRQIYLLRDNPTRLFQIFVWVILDIVSWGFISKYLTGAIGTGASIATALLGAAILWNFLTRTMHGTTTAFFEDVWARNFLNLFASPLSILEYIVGFVLVSILTSVAPLMVMLILAGIFFGFSVFIYGAALLPFLLILFVFGITLGIIGISVVMRFGPSGEWFVWPIPMMLAPLVGVFYPLSTLPEWMQYIGHLLPASYVFEGVRAVIAGNGFSLPTLMFGLGLSLVYIILAYWLFVSVYKRAIRTGLVARYSAESIE